MNIRNSYKKLRVDITGENENKGSMYFRYNSDDILEIITDYFADKYGYGGFKSKSELIVLPNGSVELIFAIDDLDSDELNDFDLIEKFREMSYNGWHDGTGLTDEQLKKAFDKINTGDF